MKTEEKEEEEEEKKQCFRRTRQQKTTEEEEEESLFSPRGKHGQILTHILCVAKLFGQSSYRQRRDA